MTLPWRSSSTPACAGAPGGSRTSLPGALPTRIRAFVQPEQPRHREPAAVRLQPLLPLRAPTLDFLAVTALVGGCAAQRQSNSGSVVAVLLQRLTPPVYATARSQVLVFPLMEASGQSRTSTSARPASTTARITASAGL